MINRSTDFERRVQERVRIARENIKNDPHGLEKVIRTYQSMIDELVEENERLRGARA
jgi:hypothetical protein